MSGYARNERVIFVRNSSISEALENMYWTPWGLCSKMTKLYRTPSAKLAGNNTSFFIRLSHVEYSTSRKHTVT
jgi:hypothetical protein